MFEKKLLEKYDQSRMYQIYDKWPEIANQSYKNNLEPVNFEGIDHIVFSGMGGSGAIGDFFASVLSKTELHVNVVKGYLLPKNVNSNSLVIITSISGNTIETLTTLKSAKKLNCKILALSSGGKLESFSLKNKIAYRKIPMIHSPRTSFVSYIYNMLKILDFIIPIEKKVINDSINILSRRSAEISSSNLSKTNTALTLARFLDRIPCIYYPHGLEPCAIRFKNSLQENAKMHVIIEDVIEACHNGIVSWEGSEKVKPVLIEGKDDYIKTKQRWKIIRNFFNENQIEFFEVHSTNGNILTKLMDLIYLFDYCSIYRAILSKKNPTTIAPIDYIKSHL